MSSDQDKILGSWFGMAVGDAMGSACRGLKPASIKQFFKIMDGYKDVRNFIGKGVRQYRMKGLYGAQTQTALALCDSLIANKKVHQDQLVSKLLEMKQTGPENYFGVFRKPEESFRRAFDFMGEPDTTLFPEKGYSTGTFLTIGVPIGLYYSGKGDRFQIPCQEAGLMFSRGFWEITGVTLTAFLIDRFQKLKPETGENIDEGLAGRFLEKSIMFCRKVELDLEEKLPHLWSELPRLSKGAVSRQLELLKENINCKNRSEILDIICKNASESIQPPVAHASQGYVLTLLPAALVSTLQGEKDFASSLTEVLHLGGESHKLGALTGAFAGAIHGFEAIPSEWKSGLVNGKEIRLRGEALIRKKNPGFKTLLEMESGLTQKEAEERRRYLSSESRKKTKKTEKAAPDPELKTKLPDRENRGQWRKYERDKSRKKRDRRKS